MSRIYNRTMIKRTVLLCVLAIFFFLENVSALTSLAKPARRGTERKSAPPFTLETSKGKMVSLSDYKGKGVVLFFFTTWCPYCRRKLSSLIQEGDIQQNKDIELLLIDTGESKRKIASFIKSQRLSLDVLLDTDMETARAYGVIGVPTFVLVSREGAIVYDGNDLPRNYQQRLLE